MATQTLRTWTNITPPVADITKGTDYYLPNAIGDVLPAGTTHADLLIDQSQQPSGQTYELAVEIGTGGAWTQIQDSLMGTGPIPFAANINTLSVGLAALETMGDHVRLHVKRYGGWLLPSVKLNVS